MDIPVFVDGEFVSASLLGSAMQSLVADIGSVGANLHTAGLLEPSALQFTPNLLVVAINAPDPFAVLFGSGYVVDAHGTADGADTTQYSVNLASLVPGSGSQTVYVVASYTTVGENLTTVVGPPIGHPDYNPNFQPFEFYTTSRASLSIAATTAAPDNKTTFELCRITLTAGQTSIQPNQIITSFQVYASAVLNPTGVTAGEYAGATITVDEYGRITAASQVNYGQISGANTWTGSNTFDQEVVAASVLADALDAAGSGGQFRAVSGVYGAILRNDGANFSLLQTPQGSPDGGYSPLRPFSWNFTTGKVTIDGTGVGTGFGGSVSLVDPNTAGLTVASSTGNKGANIKLSDGGNKFIRCLSNVLDILNSAYTTVIMSLDDLGNMALAGGMNAAGQVSGNSGAFATTLTGKTVSSTSGNVTANGGRLRATYGAAGSNDLNAALILNDIGYAVQAEDQAQFTLPTNINANFTLQCFSASVPVPGGINTYSFSIPVPFTHDCNMAICAFLGNSPPTGVSISSQPNGPSSVTVTTNSATAGGNVGVIILTMGY